MTLSELPIVDRLLASDDPERAHHMLNREEGALILVDKPYAETSFYVVNKVRKSITASTGIKRVKVGHAGTLDPLATGLLILATRRMTKGLDPLIGLDKVYRLTLRLGIHSPSYDLEKQIEIVTVPDDVTNERVAAAIMSFEGKNSQIPPMYSAIKHNGRPIYLQARKGRTLELEPRDIDLHSITDLEVSMPFASFTVHCTKGTYIRSLVRDIGEMLGTSAVLTELCRTAIGPWSLSNSLSMFEAAELAAPHPSYHLSDAEPS